MNQYESEVCNKIYTRTYYLLKNMLIFVTHTNSRTNNTNLYCYQNKIILT